MKCTFVHALEAWAVTASTRCVKASMQVWILYRTSLKATMAFLARVSNHQGGLLSLLLFSSLHPSSLFPGHHSKIPSCMKRFARNAFQCSSIIIHNGHLPLEPPIGGLFRFLHPIIPTNPGTQMGSPMLRQVWRIRRPWRDAETATIVSWTDSCKMPPGAMGRWPMGLPIDDGWLVGVVGKKATRFDLVDN